MQSPVNFTEEQLLKIHSAIHSNCRSVELNGSTYHLLDSRYSDTRYMHIGLWKFIQQNPEKKSYYGFKAKAGSQITWIVYPNKNRSWGLIENGVVIKY